MKKFLYFAPESEEQREECQNEGLVFPKYREEVPLVLGSDGVRNYHCLFNGKNELIDLNTISTIDLMHTIHSGILKVVIVFMVTEMGYNANQLNAIIDNKYFPSGRPKFSQNMAINGKAISVLQFFYLLPLIQNKWPKYNQQKNSAGI